jgi:hypothetical protein
LSELTFQVAIRIHFTVAACERTVSRRS